MIILLVSFLFVSCEENFSPKRELESQYALSSVIRGDTALQVVSLYSNYNVEGFDPSVYDENAFYKNADIRLWYQDTVYVFKDSSVANPNLADSSFQFYYLDDFKPEATGELLEIVATLKNGKRLRASCLTPGRFNFDRQNTSNTIPAVNTPMVNVFWNSEDVGTFYIVRIRVKYFELIDGVSVEKFIDLPNRILSEDEAILLYPEPSRSFSIAFRQEAINRAMVNISEGESNKSKFTISNLAVIDVLAMDENLSRYYSSTLEDNNYTVRVNQSDYSNVEGGFGLFGSLNKSSKNITIQDEYIRSFGYKVLYEN